MFFNKNYYIQRKLLYYTGFLNTTYTGQTDDLLYLVKSTKILKAYKYEIINTAINPNTRPPYTQ